MNSDTDTFKRRNFPTRLILKAGDSSLPEIAGLLNWGMHASRSLLKFFERSPKIKTQSEQL
jgi:hypothetical protein